MLTGKDLGDAIGEAIAKKGVTKKAFADAMGVKPASVQDWLKYGRVSKTRINDLVAYFSDVAGPDYWGLGFWPTHPASAQGAKTLAHTNPNTDAALPGLQIDPTQLEQFIADLREAFESGRLTSSRFVLLRGLLLDGVESQTSSLEKQQLKTRSNNGGSKRHSPKRKAG